MKDQIVHIMKYSIIGGNSLAIFLSSIWIIYMIRNILHGKLNSLSRGDIIFNLVKSTIYFYIAYVSYCFYKANDNINAHVDIISGFIYILAILEGSHNFLNSFVISILELMIKKDK